ncbi:unnamed protein product, partial [Ixodes persulcatus]
MSRLPLWEALLLTPRRGCFWRSLHLRRGGTERAASGGPGEKKRPSRFQIGENFVQRLFFLLLRFSFLCPDERAVSTSLPTGRLLLGVWGSTGRLQKLPPPP